ncbi:GreA/GreB family elongation factor [Chloroflexota bacterium]
MRWLRTKINAGAPLEVIVAEQQGVSLAEALAEFLGSLSAEQKRASQQELNRFIRWYSGKRPVAELSPQEISNYAETVLSAGPNPLKRLEPVRDFLSFAKKRGLTNTNLSVHLRASHTPQKRRTVRGRVGATSKPAKLTKEGYASHEKEVDALKEERQRLAEQIRLAAADKDFRENAPLEAARERQGQVMSRITELESIMQGATIVERGGLTATKVLIGSRVTLRDLILDEEVRYTLVGPSEADPRDGKLSIESLIGKALLDRSEGEVVEAAALAGTQRYRIESIHG